MNCRTLISSSNGYWFLRDGKQRTGVLYILKVTSFRASTSSSLWGGSQTATQWTPGTKLTEFTGDYVTEEKEPSGSGEVRNNLSYRNREQDQGATQGQEQSWLPPAKQKSIIYRATGGARREILPHYLALHRQSYIKHNPTLTT